MELVDRVPGVGWSGLFDSILKSMQPGTPRLRRRERKTPFTTNPTAERADEHTVRAFQTVEVAAGSPDTNTASTQELSVTESNGFPRRSRNKFERLP
jgi:hypothetical protein